MNLLIIITVLFFLLLMVLSIRVVFSKKKNKRGRQGGVTAPREDGKPLPPEDNKRDDNV